MILKKPEFFLIFLIFFIFQASSLYAASDNEKIFLDAVKAYERGDFKTAAEKFTHLAIDEKIVSGGLYYNLGNTWLKQNNSGMAMLWYERAKRLIPSDPDLKFNISFLESQLKDDFNLKNSVLSDEVFFLKKFMSGYDIIFSSVVCNLFFWTGAALYCFMRKKILKPVIIISGIMTFILSANSVYCLAEKYFLVKAVIIPESVSVRSGTSENASVLFSLHSGTIVITGKKQSGYVRISDGFDRDGWVASSEIAELFL